MALGRKPIEIVQAGKHQLLTKASHWQRKYLKEIATIENGYAFSSNFFAKAGGIPLIRIRDIGNNSTEDFYIGAFDRKYIVQNGDILIGMDGDFKAAIWQGKQALLNQRVCRLIPDEDKVNKTFLFICLQPYLDAIHQETSSVTVKHISSKTIEDIPIPYPPIQEQDLIVARIESLFSELDKAVENLRLVQDQLKTYRQAVLKWAFEGGFSSSSSESHHAKISWSQTILGSICDDVEYGSASKSKEFGNVPVLRMGNIQNGRFDWSDLVFTDDIAEIKKYSLSYNDVLFNRTNSPELVGKTAIYKGERPAIFAGYLIRIKYDKNKVDGDFLNYYLNSPNARAHGDSIKTFGVNQANINGTKLKQYPIYLPQLEEQVQIVQAIQNRLYKAETLQQEIWLSLKRADSLKQSILKKAFEGKLVSNDEVDEIKSTISDISTLPKVPAL